MASTSSKHYWYVRSTEGRCCACHKWTQWRARVDLVAKKQRLIVWLCPECFEA